MDEAVQAVDQAGIDLVIAIGVLARGLRFLYARPMPTNHTIRCRELNQQAEKGFGLQRDAAGSGTAGELRVLGSF
jgi:hypothetical protein